MSVYIIGDLHLSFSSAKPMDIFQGWKDYIPRLEENWNALVKPEDTVIVAGDVSWGMSLQESLADMQWLDRLPGTKWLLKGNHDYWWATAAKMNTFFEENGLTTLKILHNNCAVAEGKVFCGSRGWMMETGQSSNARLIARETGRLAASFAAADGLEGERIAVLHYPPVYGEQMIPEFLDVLFQNNVRRCYYGHVHGPAHRFAINGEYLGIDFRLISGDFIGFKPVLVP